MENKSPEEPRRQTGVLARIRPARPNRSKSAASQADEITKLIARYEADSRHAASRAEKLRALQKLLGDDPELITELRRVLFPLVGGGPPSPLAAIDTIAGVLERTKGEWLTARQIAELTHLPRNTVNYVLFTSAHRSRFESKLLGPKKKVWRLKRAAAQGDRVIRLPKVPKPVKETGKMGTD